MSGRQRALPKSLPTPRQIAKVKELAEEETSRHANAEIESHILTRIRKCLDRASHPTTPEMEAKAALHMSSRLMAQYNVAQADVLAKAIDSENQIQYAGQSKISITCTKDPFAKVISQSWVHDVASAMRVFFDCKCYSTALKWSIEWTFYGIAQNTVAAAIAFEMAHNLILEWARGKKGAINSYCLGVSAGLRKLAKEDKRQEEHEAERSEEEILSAGFKQEQLERQKALDLLNADVDVAKKWKSSYAEYVADDDDIQHGAAGTSNSSDHNNSSTDSDDETGHVIFNYRAEEEMEAEPTFKVEEGATLDPESEFEAELKHILKRERSSENLARFNSENSSPQPKVRKGFFGLQDVQRNLNFLTESSLWASASQLTLFRATATNIADEYLKSTSTKVRAGMVRVTSVRDYGAYEQGREDSRKIDVKRRRIGRAAACGFTI